MTLKAPEITPWPWPKRAEKVVDGAIFLGAVLSLDGRKRARGLAAASRALALTDSALLRACECCDGFTSPSFCGLSFEASLTVTMFMSYPSTLSRTFPFFPPSHCLRIPRRGISCELRNQTANHRSSWSHWSSQKKTNRGPFGYGSIPMKIPFLEGWTSINPSYFDVNRRGTIGFDPSPFRKFHEIFPSDVTITFFRPTFRGSFGHDAHHDP